MGEKQRLSAEARRESILRAVRRVFAENGFRGTTTRALADAAGVSEALLYKHFPNKEALYSAMQAMFTREQTSGTFRELMAAEPSTAALVRIVHEFYSALIEDQEPAAQEHKTTLARLMFRSMTEDGEFARTYLQRVPVHLVRKIAQCITAASASGDLEDRPLPADLAGWLTHHLAVMLMLNHLAVPPNLDYGMPRARLVEQAVVFALRGIGLKEKAIRRYYRPEGWGMTGG
jgi:AcrR family transcriptional regulator